MTKCKKTMWLVVAMSLPVGWRVQAYEVNDTVAPAVSMFRMEMGKAKGVIAGGLLLQGTVKDADDMTLARWVQPFAKANPQAADKK